MGIRCYYLEYNSTINCSLIFSGIASREGTFKNVPSCLLSFHSNQGESAFLEAIDSEITTSDLDFSRMPITSLKSLTALEKMAV